MRTMNDEDKRKAEAVGEAIERGVAATFDIPYESLCARKEKTITDLFHIIRTSLETNSVDGSVVSVVRIADRLNLKASEALVVTQLLLASFSFFENEKEVLGKKLSKKKEKPVFVMTGTLGTQ